MAQQHSGEEHYDGSLFGENQACFGCGPRHPFGFHLEFTREEDEVVTRMVPGASHQGAPMLLHGGLAATLADELAAWTIVILLGKFGFTTSMNCRFSRPIRVGLEVQGRGTIFNESSRLVRVNTRLLQEDKECFTAELGFILLHREGAEKLLGGPIPEEWRKYCR